MWFGYLGKQANMSSTQNSLLLKKFGEKKGRRLLVPLASVRLSSLLSSEVRVIL